MAKEFQENKDRKEAIGSFGKSIGKRAGFKCEWCESKDELRVDKAPLYRELVKAD